MISDLFVFCSLLIIITFIFHNRYLNIVFQVLDNDCNGVLNRTEAREAIDVVFQITLTDDEFDESFYEMDTDSDGSVPYKEFKKFFKHVKKQKEKILAGR